MLEGVVGLVLGPVAVGMGPVVEGGGVVMLIDGSGSAPSPEPAHATTVSNAAKEQEQAA